MALDDDVIQVRALLRGEAVQAEVIDNEQVRDQVAALLAMRPLQWLNVGGDSHIKSGLPTDNVRPDLNAVFTGAADVTTALGPIWSSLFTTNEISVADALKQARDATAGVLGASSVH